MKIPPTDPRRETGRRSTRSLRYLFGACLTILGLTLVGTVYAATFNHPPTISFLTDQRIASGKFGKQYFRIFDNEQTLTAANISVTSTNTSFTNPIGIIWGICTSSDVSQDRPSFVRLSHLINRARP